MNLHEDNAFALIELAAALRAEGQTWDAIGQAVDRHPDTVRRWPERHPERWDPIYQAVESRVIADAANEARTTLRMMLRAKAGKHRLGAAKHLISSRDRDRARAAAATPEFALSREAQNLYEVVKSMTDEELDRDIANYIRAHPELLSPKTE